MINKQPNIIVNNNKILVSLMQLPKILCHIPTHKELVSYICLNQ